MNDDDAVPGEMDVELEAVGAQRHPVVERGDRVFRRQRAAAAMGEDQRTGGGKEWVTHGTASL